MTWGSSLPATWVEFGSDALVNLNDIVFVGLDGCDLRLMLRNRESQVLTCKTAEAARGHYTYVRGVLGFPQ